MINIIVKDKKLNIQIDTDYLVYLTEINETFGWDDDKDKGALQVVDHGDWMESIRKALVSEEEDGTTLVHKMLDKAIEVSVENGELGVEVQDD